METPAQSSILAHFSLIEDPRRNHWNTLHRLYDILTIALCAVLGGADGWDDIADFGRSKHAFFTDKLKLEHGLPSSDTFRRVIASINPECFAACFLSWIEAAVGQLGGDFVGIDGKTLRGSYEKDDPKAAIHMVSAWAHANRMILGQYKVENKTNEIRSFSRKYDGSFCDAPRATSGPYGAALASKNTGSAVQRDDFSSANRC